MKSFLPVTGAILAFLLLAVTIFFFWASEGRLPEEALAQTKHYPSPPATTAPDTLTVTTYNIGYLSGMTNNKPVVRSDSLLTANMEQALSFLRETNPDLLGLQEIDYGAARSGYVQQLDTLATRLGYATATQAVNWDERYLPFPFGRPAVQFGRTLSGQAVLSRFPIRQHVRTVLPRPPKFFLRDAFYLDRLAQIALVDVGGRALALVNVHLEAFHTETREEQARIVNDIYDRFAAQGLPVLVLGDFNSTLPLSDDGRSSDAQENVNETIRLLLDGTDLHPAIPADTVDTAFPPASHPADNPVRKLDHIFYSPDAFDVVDRTVQCGAPSPPSDHCAVTATFRLAQSIESWPSIDAVPPLNSLLSD